MWLSEEAVCCRGDTASGWRMKRRLFHPARLRGALRSSAGPNRWRGGENNRQVHTVTQMSLESRTALFKRKGRKVFSWNWAQSVQAGSSSATMWPLCCGTKSHQIWFWVWVLGVWFCHTGAFPLPCITCLFRNHHIHIHKFKKKNESAEASTKRPPGPAECVKPQQLQPEMNFSGWSNDY